MDYLYQYGLFLAQAITLVAAILFVVAGILAISQRGKGGQPEGHLEVRKLNEKYRQIGEAMSEVVLDDEALKARHKAEKKAEKEEKKKTKKQSAETASKKRLYVLEFDGDMKASATGQLREEISAVTSQYREGDEVLVKLESPGGLVHGYGLAASQLQRIRDAGIPLTVAVDKVAASGGYMMACVANTIVAAPFAVIGSIGVLAQIPNFHRLLKKNDVDFELFTAGEYKRTVTMFGENTEHGREKFVQELEDTHNLFKDFVHSHRPQLDITTVATGETWYGSQAVEKGLVDKIATSDGYIQSHLQDWDIFEVRFVQKKNWQEKLGLAAEGAMERAFLKIWQQGRERPPV